MQFVQQNAELPDPYLKKENKTRKMRTNAGWQFVILQIKSFIIHIYSIHNENNTKSILYPQTR